MDSIKQTLWAITLWLALTTTPSVVSAQKEVSQAVSGIVSESKAQLRSQLDSMYDDALETITQLTSNPNKIPGKEDIFMLNNIIQVELKYYKTLSKEEKQGYKQDLVSMIFLFGHVWHNFITHHLNILQSSSRLTKQSQQVKDFISVLDIYRNWEQDLLTPEDKSMIKNAQRWYNNLPN